MVYANRYSRTSASKILRVLFLALNSFCFRIATEKAGKVDAYNVVRVCQNKHCCKRTKVDVLQTIHNLVDTNGGDKNDVVVEASGCLSHCDNGPNVEVTTESGTVLLNGMTDSQICAFQLGEISSSTPSFPPVPKILAAASKVMEQSQRFSDMGQLEEEIRFLTSVIDKLESSPVVSPSTSANAHAHALRARAHLQLARNEKQKSQSNNSNNNNEENQEISGKDEIAAAIHDAQRVVQDLSAVATPTTLSLAYRAWTDAELIVAQHEQQQRQQEKEALRKKDFSRVVAVLTEWYRAQPMYRTKLQGEIQGLLLNT